MPQPQTQAAAAWVQAVPNEPTNFACSPQGSRGSSIELRRRLALAFVKN